MRKRLVTLGLILSLLYCPGCVGLIATAIIIKKKRERAAKAATAEPAPPKIEAIEEKRESRPVEITKEPEPVRHSGRDDFTSAPPAKD